MADQTEVLDLCELTWFVKSRYGIDLSRYRSTCLHRRVMHRMVMAGCNDIEDYMNRISTDPGEIEKLMDVVTIHVTEFYRDREVFGSLERGYVPALIAEKETAGHGVFSAWSAGCSTGEEAYSMAMLLDRAIKRVSPEMCIEIFGTDVSEDACRRARKGRYTSEKISQMPPAMRDEYFEKEGRCWKVAPNLKKLVKFDTHDLFSPAPYSDLDLIMCRNVLIHFEHEVRDEIMSHFFGSLQSRGLLVLGKSEALMGRAEDMFDLVEPRCKIYRKKPQV